MSVHSSDSIGAALSWLQRERYRLYQELTRTATTDHERQQVEERMRHLDTLSAMTAPRVAPPAPKDIPQRTHHAECPTAKSPWTHDDPEDCRCHLLRLTEDDLLEAMERKGIASLTIKSAVAPPAEPEAALEALNWLCLSSAHPHGKEIDARYQTIAAALRRSPAPLSPTPVEQSPMWLCKCGLVHPMIAQWCYRCLHEQADMRESLARAQQPAPAPLSRPAPSAEKWVFVAKCANCGKPAWPLHPCRSQARTRPRAGDAKP